MEYFYLILLGFASGFINVFAGGGSMLVVPFLIIMGLPANVANATNRVAIFLQNIVSVSTFRHQKILNLKTDYKLLIPTLLGSITGAFIAVDIDETILKKLIASLLIFLFFLILLKPNAWIKTRTTQTPPLPTILRFLLFYGIGFYGGFIQIGVGFFLLTGLVLGYGADLLKANAIKVLLVFCYTFFVLLIFIYYRLIDWPTGLILACGNMSGAWVAARLSIRWGSRYIRYILLITIIFVALRLWEIL